MAWIESHDTLKDHPKTRRFRRLLGINLAQAIGHLHMIWWWALEYAEDGDLSKYDEMDIAEAAEWDGDEVQFLTALIDSGFVDKCDDGGLYLHDWHDYAGRLLEQRAKNRERQRRYRQRQRNTNNEPRNANVTRDKRVTNELTVPNHNHTVPNHTDRQDDAPAREPDPLPEPFASSVGPSVGPGDELPEPHDGMTLQDVAQRYQHRIGIMGPSVFERMREWHEDHGMSLGVVALAIDETAEARSENRCRNPDAYLNGVLRNSHNDGVRTVADWQAKKRADPRRAETPEEAEAYLDSILGAIGVDSIASA